jgi:hypothetical protein
LYGNRTLYASEPLSFLPLRCIKNYDSLQLSYHRYSHPNTRLNNHAFLCACAAVPASPNYRRLPISESSTSNADLAIKTTPEGKHGALTLFGLLHRVVSQAYRTGNEADPPLRRNMRSFVETNPHQHPNDETKHSQSSNSSMMSTPRINLGP